MQLSSRIFGSTLGLLLGASMAASCYADVLADIKGKQTLTIAYRDKTPPFSYIVKGKEPIGYAIDICDKVAEAIKKELKLPKLKVNYVPVDTDTRFTRIAKGEVHMECGTTSNTPEREKEFDFSIPYFFTTTRMLVRSDSGILKWPDLKGKTVVATKGTSTIKQIQTSGELSLLKLKVIEGMDHVDSQKILTSSKADAYLSQDVLLYFAKEESANPNGWMVSGSPISASGYGILLAEDPKFKKMINTELGRMMLAGEIDTLYEKWFLRPIPPKNVNLKMSMHILLREIIRLPSSQ
jgi:ABC-type amino acid transport substrate-binding protein